MTLQGQVLPWKAALRHASGRTACSRTYLAIHINTLSTSTRLRTARSPLRPSRTSFADYGLPPLRSFSNAAARRKEKPASEDDPEAKEKEENEEQNTPAAKPEDESGATDRVPDPIPKSKSEAASDGSSGTARASTSGGTGAPSSEGGGASSGSGSRKRKATPERSLSKPTVPEVYPQVMAIPLAKRPLFPGWYKAISIKNPDVIAAIQEMMKRGQPYVGAFLMKDDSADKDVIDDINEVYDVGTFCQITSIYPFQGEEKVLQAVLYPHRRIRLSELISPKGQNKTINVPSTETEPQPQQTTSEEQASEKPDPEKRGDVVASFEEPSASSDASKQQIVSYEPTSFLSKYAVSLVSASNVTDEPFDKSSPTIRALVSEIVNVVREIAIINPLFRDQIQTFATTQIAGNMPDDPARLSDFAAAVAQGEVKELQEILAATNIEKRLNQALFMIKKDFMNAQLQSKIAKDVEGRIHKRQREYFLQEQLKGIKRELGIESDGKDKLVEKFKEKADKLAMPEGVRKVFDEEINKLAHLETAASEFNVTRNYLDWLTQIPWGQRSAENFGIHNARRVLDEDHHGLKDVKDRILEFIAVGKLRGTVEGKILCMVGPPGVGKTSIGKSIARALNRQYYRFSVGGLTDVAEIKGHRRTYVGALPGRIIQALKKCQTENPLVLIDEVDKIGRGHQGDPASALLELLDPEQNNSFLDHYMDVPVDLSKVLFVCTANMTDTIPRPLLDRMEMIELSGYVSDEKMAIAERYLAPQAKDMSGLKDVDVALNQDAIVELINKYCRESGVRNLKKQIEKIYRKSALKIIQDLGENSELSEDNALTAEGKQAQEAAKKDDTDVKDTPENIEKETTETPRVALKVPDSVHVVIDKDNLKDYVGAPIFTSDRLYETTPPGVAMGLAWTQMGGAALYVESVLSSALSAAGAPALYPTGNLKPVMKESSSIAYSFAKAYLTREFPANRFFERAKIHLHCPEGAVQKDGPSAGITMATSLLSLAMDEPVADGVAMTGELTVTGKVLRIGGLREKTVAARRAGAKTIVFPRENESDWLELPENIKQDIEGKPIEWYSDIFDLVFPNVDREKVSNLWKDQLKKSEDNDEKDEKDKDKKDKEDDD
ncbi:MAG: ATP-dependent Lon protease pim1 [Bathelium mastoideum]|nr:MAG: ATP-dependent Lon protease pim1 [Bathelium mastoideum]